MRHHAVQFRIELPAVEHRAQLFVALLHTLQDIVVVNLFVLIHVLAGVKLGEVGEKDARECVEAADLGAVAVVGEPGGVVEVIIEIEVVKN